MDLPLVLDDLDDVAAQVKEFHLTEPELPPTALFVYHDGLLSAMFHPPEPYCWETADEIRSTTTRLLQELQPDALAMFVPAAYTPDDDPDQDGEASHLWWAMKVYSWQRHDDGTNERRARVLPMPINGSPDGPMFDLDAQAADLDPLFGAVGAAFEQPPQRNGFLLDLTWLPPGWEGAARPGGLLDATLRLDHPN